MFFCFALSLARAYVWGVCLRVRRVHMQIKSTIDIDYNLSIEQNFKKKEAFMAVTREEKN